MLRVTAGLLVVAALVATVFGVQARSAASGDRERAEAVASQRHVSALRETRTRERWSDISDVQFGVSSNLQAIWQSLFATPLEWNNFDSASNAATGQLDQGDYPGAGATYRGLTDSSAPLGRLQKLNDDAQHEAQKLPTLYQAFLRGIK